MFEFAVFLVWLILVVLVLNKTVNARSRGERVLGCLMLSVMLTFCGLVLYPVYVSAKIAAVTTRCMSNIKGLAMSQYLYASDNDDKFAANWADHVGDPNVTWKCPNGKTDFSYAMNKEWVDVRTAEAPNLASTVLIFESDCDHKGVLGGEELVARPPRHGPSNFVGFADGHAGRRSEPNWHVKLRHTASSPARSDEETQRKPD